MILFAADVHLHATTPVRTAAFIHWIRRCAARAQAVYLLGDLFDLWLGDDDTEPYVQSVIAALQYLHQLGVPCYIQHGNRDFLLGMDFCRATGCILLAEQHILEARGQRILLMHGDTLCINDTAYQDLRQRLRTPQWQQDFLRMPLKERKISAQYLREHSTADAAQKITTIMDVTSAAVNAAMIEYRADALIHGHTHRPGRHTVHIAGRIRQRWVLGLWHPQGWYARLAAGKIQLLPYDLSKF